MATTRKLPSGKHQGMVRLKGMEPRYASFSTKAKATQWAEKVEEATALARKLRRYGLNPGELIAVPSFSDVVEQYIEQYTGRDRGTRGKLNFWVQRFGDKQATEVTEFDVDDGHGDPQVMWASIRKLPRLRCPVLMR
jgi:hypothetical protein